MNRSGPDLVLKVVGQYVSVPQPAAEAIGVSMCHRIGDPSLRQAKSWLPLSAFFSEL